MSSLCLPGVKVDVIIKHTFSQFDFSRFSFVFVSIEKICQALNTVFDHSKFATSKLVKNTALLSFRCLEVWSEMFFRVWYMTYTLVKLRIIWIELSRIYCMYHLRYQNTLQQREILVQINAVNLHTFADATHLLVTSFSIRSYCHAAPLFQRLSSLPILWVVTRGAWHLHVRVIDSVYTINAQFLHVAFALYQIHFHEAAGTNLTRPTAIIINSVITLYLVKGEV